MTRPQPLQLNLKTLLFDQAYVLLTLTVLFWSGNIVLGRAMQVQGQIPPIALAFWRWFGAFVVLIPIAGSHVKSERDRLLRHWPIISLLALLGITAFNSLLYTGLQFTTAINGLLLQTITPLLIVVISFFAFRETISRFQILGILLALIGAAVIVVRGDWQTLITLSLNPGDLWISCAVLCYSLYSVLLRKRPVVHPLSFLLTSFGLGSLFLFPCYLWEIATGARMILQPSTFLTIGYVALFPSIISYFCFNRGVELIGANRAGLFLYLIPFFGSILSMILLKESFQTFHLLGGGLILIGIVIFVRMRQRTVTSADP